MEGVRNADDHRVDHVVVPQVLGVRGRAGRLGAGKCLGTRRVLIDDMANISPKARCGGRVLLADCPGAQNPQSHRLLQVVRRSESPLDRERLPGRRRTSTVVGADAACNGPPRRSLCRPRRCVSSRS